VGLYAVIDYARKYSLAITVTRRPPRRRAGL